MHNLFRLIGILSATLACLLSLPASAQQTNRIIVPFTSGGAADTFTRVLAAELSASLGPTVVENRPGASGIIAAEALIKSPADGRTLMFGSNSTMVNNTVLFAKLPYDPQKDFALVSHIGYQPMMIVARVDLPYKTLQEMVAYAKANPGRINRGSAGAGNITNLAAAVFGKMAGINITHVPFAGDAPALQALLSGSIELHVSGITAPLPHIKAGRMRILAVMDAKHLADVPEAPTMKESGYDMEASAWYCLVAPAATGRDAVDRVNKAVNVVESRPEVVQKIRSLGIEPRAGSVDDLDRFIKAELQRWIPTIRELGIKPE